jgi:hypothetical protein
MTNLFPSYPSMPQRDLFDTLACPVAQVPERLSQWQWVNLHDDRSYDRLIAALRKRNSQLGRAAKAN